MLLTCRFSLYIRVNHQTKSLYDVPVRRILARAYVEVLGEFLHALYDKGLEHLPAKPLVVHGVQEFKDNRKIIRKFALRQFVERKGLCLIEFFQAYEIIGPLEPVVKMIREVKRKL